MFLWICFNAWLAFESKEDIDVDMIRWLAGQHAEQPQLRAAFDLAAQSEDFVAYLRTLVSLSPIASTGRIQRRAIRIKSPADFANIAGGVYRVRCNLFHGGKSVRDSRDETLIRTCAQILEQWVGNLIAGW